MKASLTYVQLHTTVLIRKNAKNTVLYFGGLSVLEIQKVQTIQTFYNYHVNSMQHLDNGSFNLVYQLDCHYNQPKKDVMPMTIDDYTNT